MIHLVSFRLLGFRDPSPVRVVLSGKSARAATKSQKREPQTKTYFDVRAKHVVPPAETCRVAAQDRGVVEIVVIGSCPEWEDMTEGPWEIVARVRIDCLEEPETDPDVDGEDVEVVPSDAVEEGSGDSAQCEDQDFEGMSILRGLTMTFRFMLIVQEGYVLTKPMGAENS